MWHLLEHIETGEIDLFQKATSKHQPTLSCMTEACITATESHVKLEYVDFHITE